MNISIFKSPDSNELIMRCHEDGYFIRARCATDCGWRYLLFQARILKRDLKSYLEYVQHGNGD